MVVETPIEHDEQVSTIIQRETDMQFLKRLALRNGFECYVEGQTGFFAPPQLNGKPQPVLAVHFGQTETNVNRFSLEVNALTPTNVRCFRWTDSIKTLSRPLSQRPASKVLGRQLRQGLSLRAWLPGAVYVSMNATTGTAEMDTLCQELFHQAEWFVTRKGRSTAIATTTFSNRMEPSPSKASASDLQWSVLRHACHAHLSRAWAIRSSFAPNGTRCMPTALRNLRPLRCAAIGSSSTAQQ